MNKIVVGIIIAIVILGGGYYLFIQNSSTANRIKNTDVKDNRGAMERYDDSASDSVLPEKGSYTLDSENSKLIYSAARFTGRPNTGNVSISFGSLILGKGEHSGNFTIDMTTITESKNNDNFLGHINSADFFDVENHPTAEFSITRIEPSDNESLSVTGKLSILSITNEITFKATPKIKDDVITVIADIVIDRTMWGINFDSGSVYKELGDKAIKDEVEIKLELQFTPLSEDEDK